MTFLSLRSWLIAAALSLTVASAQNPASLSTLAASRFLGQASWGPTPESVAHLQQVGFEAWIQEQFSATASRISDVPDDVNGRAALGPVQQEFFANTISGQDQLRQRVAFALSHIWVVSGLKLTDAKQMVPWIRLLSADAFENYRTIMYDVTLSPAMGRYLDMVNNDKPNKAKGTGADENYARELLQLFTIGLSQLNPDGSVKLDGSGQPIPSYTQDQIEGFARTFTGWTYAAAPGTLPKTHNPANWTTQMSPVESNHDTDAKALLNGVTLPAGQNATKDLSDALDNIFHHANVGPFICRQLIQHPVTSAPSPAYIQRVAQVFADDGSGIRGDMKAVVRAILLDSEARNDSAASSGSGGHLTEPVLYISSVIRALGALTAAVNGLASLSSAQGQNVFLAPSVFDYFSPDYTVEGTHINAPEFQILSPSTAMTRADFVNSLVYGRITGVTLSLSPFTGVASDPNKLLDLVSARFFGGSMPGTVRQSILKAVASATTATAKSQAAIYLSATSGAYQVQH